MHPLFARQTPGDPVFSEPSSETGSGPTGEPSNSAAAPSTSEVQPPVSESTPPAESSSESPPPVLSSSEEPSPSPSTPLEESSTTPLFTPSETTTQSETSTIERLETLTTPSSPPSTESTDSAASLTTVTTTVNGLPTTYVTPIPTNSRIGADGGGDSRTGLIAGLTAGLIALLVVFLSGVFLYRRHRLRRRLEVLTAEKKRKEGRSLLDGEGFEDDDHDLSEHGSRRGFVVMRSYNNVNQQPRTTPLSSPTPYSQTQRSASPTFSMLRSRASESGSIFREDVWPPPSEGLVDPITKESSQVDLSRVVDEVMGPSSAQPHSRQGTHTSSDSMSPLILNHDHDTTHSRGPSVDSQYMDPFQPTSLSSSSFVRPQSTSYPSLAGAAVLASLSSSPSGGVASSPTNLPQLSQVLPPPPATMSTSSIPLHPRPPSPIAFVGSPTSFTPFSGSYTPTPPGAVAVLPASSSSSQQRSTPPIVISPISTKTTNRSSVPKKSSPLARKLSQDALTWLSRGGPTGAASQSKHS